MTGLGGFEHVAPLLVGQMTAEIAVVTLVVFVALALFVTETLPVDITAISVLVVLVMLEPWTGVAPADGISGFANPATITVLAMFVLSEAVRQSGVTRLISSRVIEYTGDDERKQLGITMGIAGGIAGFVNNTPVVAVMIPTVTEIAERTGVSPSKLLLPLSYAAMLGGTLTLIGTSPNLIASDLSNRAIGRPFTMFEFTQLGVLVLAAGVAYVLLVGRHLIPARLQPDADLIDRFELAEYLAEIRIGEESAIVGERIVDLHRDLSDRADREFQVLRVVRGGEAITQGLSRLRLQAGDLLVARGDRETLLELDDQEGVEFEEERLTEARLTESSDAPLRLVELTLLPNSRLEGQTLGTASFRRRYGISVLAIRRRGRVLGGRLRDISLQGGDTFLVHAPEDVLDRLAGGNTFVVSREIEHLPVDRRRAGIVGATIVGVVGVAALGWLPIVITALAGIVVLVATGCLRPMGMYEAVDWNVIFLIAGIIPLGIALERSGTAALLASGIVPLGEVLPPILFLMCFYLVIAILTEMITNVASVVLMFPIAMDVAAQLGTDPFTYALLVTFAASSSLMTPIGYQTNLMVFNRGGYRFTDFLRVGIPLQIILAMVTAGGLLWFWGI